MSLCGLGLSCEPLPCEHGKELRKEQCSLCELKTQIMALTDMYKELSIRVIAQHDFKLRQIDENQKMLRRFDKLESQDKNGYMYQQGQLDFLIARLSKLETQADNNDDKVERNKSPHKCPACDGKGYGKEAYSISMDGIGIGVKNHPCHACEGKGIVWG